MKRILARGTPTLAGLCAAALALFAAAQPGPSPALATSATSAASALRPTAAPASTAPAWTGSFSGINDTSWHSTWGATSDSAQCAGASGTFSCNWGYSNMQAVNDGTAPGGGPALKLTYPAKSGPPSCYLSVSGCVLGGGQFYQDLTTNGETALAQSPSLDLKYDYDFPVGFDFGGKTAGKMPGLWGGGVMGCESGAQHCAQGWSTRYMWKGGSSTAPNGELYFYTSSGSGYGADLCNGNWKFAADGKWHSIEQQVNINTGSITIWSDGTQVCQVTEPMPGANSGIFFSTFHGGHDLSYSPSKTVTAEFADFSLATAGPQSTNPTTPASPSGVTASATSGSSIALSWTEQNNGDPAASYRVYEGSSVVATSTSTSATITGLAAGSTHTYTVTAVDASGNESTPSASVTATTPGNTTTPATPSGLTVSGTTSSSASLSWAESNNGDPAASYRVYEGTSVVATSTSTSATIAGLAAGSTHTYTVTAVDAAGNESPKSASATATTQGSSTAPATPSGLTVSGTTSSSASLSWAESNNGDPAASYRVYEGTSVVATSTSTSATITGLAAGSTHTYTVTSVDGSGVESAHSTSATATTSGGSGGLSVTLAKTKDWGSGYTDTATLTNTSGSAVNGWNVQFDLDPSENIESSAGVSYACSANHCTLANLSSDATVAPGTSLNFQFSGDYPSGGHYIAPTNVTAYALGGGSQSPATPTGLTVTGTTNTSVSLAWTESNNSDPAASYQVDEGGVVIATVTGTSATISGLNPGTSYTFTVTALDAAGDGSAQSSPVTATTQSSTTTPATPTGLTVAGTTANSVSLSWTETNNGDPAASYRVYEGSSVVASPAATNATISGLTAGTSYSFTVAAVDASAVQSPQSASVTATTPGGTGGVKFSQTDIDSAVGSPLIAFAAPTSSVPRPGTNPTNIGESAVLQYLALVDKEQPGATASNGTTVDSALLAQVRNLIAGGNEPDADGGLEGWSHALVAEALLLVKNGPAWGELTATEQNKVTLLEAAMGYAGNYTYNDANNFSSGICGFGNFSKTNNPNYRDGYVDVELAAIQYFGASTWTSMLQNFNDANEVSALTASGLTNAAGCYKTVGSAADSAIGRPFVYQGVAATDVMGLWNVLASDTFDLTATSSVSGTASGSSVTAHIADNTTSPEQGKTGMGKEFDATDSQGLRSSALYVFEGWMNVTGSRLAMTALGNYSCSAASAAAPYQVGSLDLIYKLHHGYVGYALNQSGVLVNDSGSPSTDGPNAKGYQYDLDSYNNLISDQGC
jgi:fibronectin type 3 domain-containing protein